MPSPISPEDGTKPTDTRRGRAWIDRAAGVRIGYTLAGISPGTPKTVLLIHGAPQTGYAWRKVVPTLVAAGYQVAEENPDYFCRMFIDFDTSARIRQPTRLTQ